MRSNSLLMSLLANSSANPRSNSLMHKDNYTNPFSLGGRSNSLSYVQVEKRQKALNGEDNVRLVRMVHLFNLKVKNNYYFFICKLESILKKDKKVKKQEIKLVDNYEIPLESNQQQERSPNVPGIDNKQVQCKTKCLTILCDSFNTFKSKRETLLEKQLILNGFKCLKKLSNQIKGLQKFEYILSRKILNQQRIVFHIFAKIEKERIRNQIFSLNLQQIITKQYAQTFKTIQFFGRQFEDKHKVPLKSTAEDARVYQLHQNLDSISKVQQQCLSKHQNGDKTSRSKKIILRERKASVAQPLSFMSDKSKVVVAQDIPLCSSIGLKFQQKMGRLHNMKPDTNLSCMPDLNDNCHLFRECQMPSLSIKTMTTVQNYYTQLDCLTDRSAKNNQQHQQAKSLKNTPKYCKDKSSINLAVKKEVHLTNPQSPLAKIDEILNRIEQMRSYRSTQISCQKKTANSNIQKKAQLQQASSIRYRTKTPSNKYEQSQKQNVRQRLITERQKAVKKIRGIESSSKYKSTVLTKSKDQNKEFTAKKMKMEIQNIINRRNKQLYYRAESTQLT